MRNVAFDRDVTVSARSCVPPGLPDPAVLVAASWLGDRVCCRSCQPGLFPGQAYHATCSAFPAGE